MCGRYTYYSSADLISEFKLIPKDDPQTKLALEVHDNYNVSPGNEMPVIVRGKQEHQIEFMVWGLVPAWSKEPHTALKLINARKEGLFEKPMWKRLVNTKRCVVPARGFYEWKLEDGRKQPYYITPTNGDVFSFAGLWDEWSDGKGNILKTYTIVTTTPNKEMNDIHNRMPAILTQEQMDIWLNPIELTREQVEELLSPSPDGSVQMIAVSTEVNNARNNSKELIYPLED
jgi:putative SOS response-associated peptidase YedK